MPSIFDFVGNNRSIYLFDTIYCWSTESLVKDLLRMNDESKEDPINIFINSPGGVVTDTLGIIDVMNAIQAPINTVILGTAYSAASLIAACGDKRFISPNSEMMIHEAAMQGFGYIDTRDEKFTNNLKRVEELNERINAIYAKKTGQSFEEITKIMSSKDDVFMTAEESIKFGLVDEIMTDEQLSKIKLSETIKLSEAFDLEESENELKRVHLLKVCELKDKGVEITESMLEGAKNNFDSNVRGIDISIDYTHENDNGENPAAAWIKSVELSEDKQDLYGMVEFTPKGQEMAKSKEYKYFSVELSPLYQNEDGKMYSNVLLGGTFTNRPAVKGLDPIKLSETNNNKIDMELTKEEMTSIDSIKSEMQVEIKDFYSSFAEMKKTNENLMSEKAELESNQAKLQTEATEATAALAKITQETIKTEKLSAVDGLIEKGIIINAQKEKVLNQFSSKDEILEFYKDVPASVTVEAKGSDLEDPKPEDSKLQELAKQTGQSVEDLIKYGMNK